MNVLIVGCGNLGYRHSQGVLSSRFIAMPSTTIDLFDIEIIAAESLKQRLIVESCLTEAPRIQVLKRINDFSDHYDLVIDATTANTRPKLTRDLKAIVASKWWILEKPISQSAQGIAELQRLFRDELVWVNIPRRMTNLYSSVAKEIASMNFGNLELSVSGQNWGLASNAIHFLELYRYLSGGSVSAVSASAIVEWCASKRAGFFECYGEIVFQTDSGVIELSCFKGENFQREVRLSGSEDLIKIYEESGLVDVNGSLKKFNRLSLQSEMTGVVLDELMQSETCRLPQLTEVISESVLVSNFLSGSFKDFFGKSHDYAQFT